MHIEVGLRNLCVGLDPTLKSSTSLQFDFYMIDSELFKDVTHVSDNGPNKSPCRGHKADDVSIALSASREFCCATITDNCDIDPDLN